MRGISRKLQYIKNIFSRQKPEQGPNTEEKWTADFGKIKNNRFDIISETSHDANIIKNLSSSHSLLLGIKKTGCIAWSGIQDFNYRDLVISASIRIDAESGYGAGGIFFRMVDSGTYYSFLISNKDYYRLDLVRNGMPLPLIGWTELPVIPDAEKTLDFSIINFGKSIIITIGGQWAGEISDPSIPEGCIALAAVSYNEDRDAAKKNEENNEADDPYTVKIYLDSLTIESRFDEVSAEYDKHHDEQNIDPRTRINLANTFAAINHHSAALAQLQKCSENPSYKKTQADLLLAGKLSLALELYPEAEAYIKECYGMDPKSPEAKESLVETAKILDINRRYKELKKFSKTAIKEKPKDPVLHNLQGHAFWNLNEYENAAKSYEKAFQLDEELIKNTGGTYTANIHAAGIYAKNAANVYNTMGKKEEALELYFKAGRSFLNTGNYNDLGSIIPILLTLGEKNWEARGLAGKWAFAVEDWNMAESEFKNAEKLRSKIKPKPKEDSALVFLEALLFIRFGKHKEALPLLRKAVKLEKDYGLYQFRLAETLFYINNDPSEKEMLDSMNKALELSEKENPADGLFGWVNHFAALISVRNEKPDEAEVYLKKAANILGEDPGGIILNIEGDILVKQNRYEEAAEKYKKALEADPSNPGYNLSYALCLIEMGQYGEADELLVNIPSPDPAVLEMISYVAVKKGEYARAEEACRRALDIDPLHAPSLLSLGNLLLNQAKYEECGEIIERLDNQFAKAKGTGLNENLKKGLNELRYKADELIYDNIGCASCDRSWKVLKFPPPLPVLRLYDIPPDELPAGTCPECEKTYCIGCAKKRVDKSGRFICPSCKKTLKLNNEGLKKLLYDWDMNK